MKFARGVAKSAAIPKAIPRGIPAIAGRGNSSVNGFAGARVPSEATDPADGKPGGADGVGTGAISPREGGAGVASGALVWATSRNSGDVHAGT